MTTRDFNLLMLFTKRKNAPQSRTVSFDAFGNAIPDTPSIQDETSSVAATIVETREVVVSPRKITTNKPTAEKTLFTGGVLQALSPWRSRLNTTITRPKTHTIADPELIYRQEHVSSILELGFRKLHEEFERREQQMEHRFQIMAQQMQSKPLLKAHWVITLAVTGSLAVGYVLYLLTSMQNSMNIMSSSIPAMNQHINSMANDTRNMSGNMQALNGNVSQMNTSFQQMNQQMSTVSNAMAPMGKVARTTQPFFSMMRHFMPF